MSKGAQGAIIGGVTGAAAGTVIGKNAKGAAIGAAVGAAGGYLIGREKDKKDGRVKSKDDKKE
ncbi:MAG: glycine zipper 2TM domain-containing protein [Ferruginibacter sp.]|nr:glycine zipper 2TM domain-containing protein [Ferruginibacter sp.]